MLGNPPIKKLGLPCCTDVVAKGATAIAPDFFIAAGGKMGGKMGAAGAAGVALLAMLTGGTVRAKPYLFRRQGKRLVGCAASPASDASFDPSREEGVTPPCGKPGAFIWDPAGLAKNIDASTFRQYRQAELKHGRICMVAVMGLIGQSAFTFPGLSYVPRGIAAAAEGQVTSPTIGLIFLLVAAIELNTSDEGREPGDLGDPADIIKSGLGRQLGVPAADSFEFPVWRDFELNHCRLAMAGFAGAVMAEYATGLTVIDQWKAAGAAWNLWWEYA